MRVMDREQHQRLTRGTRDHDAPPFARAGIGARGEIGFDGAPTNVVLTLGQSGAALAFEDRLELVAKEGDIWLLYAIGDYPIDAWVVLWAGSLSDLPTHDEQPMVAPTYVTVEDTLTTHAAGPASALERLKVAENALRDAITTLIGEGPTS